MTTVFDASSLDGTTDGGGDNGVAFRQIVHSSTLSAATGNQVQVSFRTGSGGGVGPSTITGAWIGRRSGATNNFTGNQVQLKFAGGSTAAWNVANTTITSDVATLGEAFDNTKDYIVTFRVLDTPNTATTTFGTFTGNDSASLSGSSAGEEALTTASGGYTTSTNTLQFLRQIIITAAAAPPPLASPGTSGSSIIRARQFSSQGRRQLFG